MSGSCRRSGAEPSGRDRQQPEAADDAPAGSRVRTLALTPGCGSTLAIVVIAVGSAVLAFIDNGPAPFALTDTDATCEGTGCYHEYTVKTAGADTSSGLVKRHVGTYEGFR